MAQPTIFTDAGVTWAEAGDVIGTVRDTKDPANIGSGIDAVQSNAALKPTLVDQGNDYFAARFDGSDDKLTLTFADGLDGDLFLAGKGGCWVEEGISIASAGTLDIGPVNGPKTPGLIRAVGGANRDLLAAIPIDRTLTDYERKKLAEYYKARGGKGLLTAEGLELITDPGFTGDGSAYTTSGTVDFSTSGQVTLTAAPGSASYIAQQITADVGDHVLIKSDLTALTQGGDNRATIRIGNAASSTIDYFSGIYNGAQAVGEYEVIHTVRRLNPWVTWHAATDTTFTLGSVSIKLLQPEEDW